MEPAIGKVLHLWPFSLDDFEKAIDFWEGEVSLLAEAHYAILRIDVKDSNGYQDLVQKKGKPSFHYKIGRTIFVIFWRKKGW